MSTACRCRCGTHQVSIPFFVFLLRPNSLALYLLDRLTIRHCVGKLGETIVEGNVGHGGCVFHNFSELVYP